jgi:hypothetical protein
MVMNQSPMNSNVFCTPFNSVNELSPTIHVDDQNIKQNTDVESNISLTDFNVMNSSLCNDSIQLTKTTTMNRIFTKINSTTWKSHALRALK